MTRKNCILIALALLLGAFSLYLNRDWFAKDTIQIFSRSLPPRPMPGGRKRPEPAPAVNPITFGFTRSLKLTELKVVPVSDIETNKYPHPIWHLVSDSNSVPVRELSYGIPIRGMRPSVKGATAYPLDPGAKYRLFVESPGFKGEHDFVPVARKQ
jgi:hypothetical protein